MKKLMFSARLKAWQLRGKVRRFVKCHFPALDGNDPRRFGSCSRCGACCKILLKCPFLAEAEDGYICSIYERRPTQCRRFPVESLDLTELESGCTYYFMG